MAWVYRDWSIRTNQTHAPDLDQHLRSRYGFLSSEDVRVVLEMVASHCLVASVTGSTIINANLGLERTSDIGLVFNEAATELNFLMANFNAGRTNALIEQFLYMEEVGWLSIESMFLRYSQAGLLAQTAPVGASNPSRAEDRSHSSLSAVLFGLSSGRVTREEARILVQSVQQACLIGSGIHFHATRLRLGDYPRPQWH